MAKKKQPKRITVTDTLSEISPYEFEGKVLELIARLESLVEQHGVDASINWDPWHHHDYDPNPSPQFTLTVIREETDQEYEKRIHAEAVRKSIDEAREREEFERLQKKFGAKK